MVKFPIVKLPALCLFLQVFFLLSLYLYFDNIQYKKEIPITNLLHKKGSVYTGDIDYEEYMHALKNKSYITAKLEKNDFSLAIDTIICDSVSNGRVFLSLTLDSILPSHIETTKSYVKISIYNSLRTYIKDSVFK